ncbi:MAG: hypothetical protein CMJ76_11305 [Planctomycetaceae bacterium]|nr:hypothetical protein [Planctomycetaceae bacterium]
MFGLIISFVFISTSGYCAEISDLTKTINKIGPKGAGHAEARMAMAELSKTDVNDVSDILAGFDSRNKLAVNWLRAAVDTVLDKAQQQGKEMPVDALREFLAETKYDSNARRVAYEWLIQIKPELRQEILTSSLNDPSLEIRREAITNAVEAAVKQKTDSPDEALKQLKSILNSARDIDQIDEVTQQIETLGGKVDLPTHFGFLMNWNLIGPFDNSGTKGFDVVYAPEATVELDKALEGKSGNIKWFAHTTEDRYGLMDLNVIMPEKYKGAIAYAHTTFQSDKEQEVDVRLGCINGNKIWINGKLITSNHVYHANTSIDQYIARAKLNKGNNIILVKIAQNEQEESWAQRWQFQLRICDESGTAILAADRN